jgi:hypothetical protein
MITSLVWHLAHSNGVSFEIELWSGPEYYERRGTDTGWHVLVAFFSQSCPMDTFLMSQMAL